MRVVISVLLLLVVSAPGGAAHKAGGDDGQIVPGERIGAARLGMSEVEIEAINSEALCPVSATYDPSGSALRLVTTWGGGCRVSEQVQVGVGFAPALDTFGSPDEVTEDARYGGASAYWASYDGWGIAFRVLVIGEAFTMIQAIAIFRGTAVVAARPHLPKAEPWK